MKILAVIALVVLALLATGVFLLERYVRSEAFKQAVLGAAREALRADVRVGGMRVSLLRGATLEGVTIANPPGFPGDFLTADALVVRYRVWPLLRRRLELDEVSLERPSLRLVRGERGEWNYAQVGSRPVPPTAGSPGSAPPEVASPRASGGGLDVVSPRLNLRRGDVTLVGERGRSLARLEGLDLEASVSWIGQALTGNGTARIETLALGDTRLLRQLAGPVRLAAGEVSLAPLTGRLAEGEVAGALVLRLGGRPVYSVDVRIKDADVEALLREGGARRGIARGRLQAQATFEGMGGLATVTGGGRAEIHGGTLLDMPALTLLGTVLGVPALRDLAFEESRLEFRLADNVLHTDMIRVVARDLQITGAGTVLLATRSLDHRMTLAIAKELLRRTPREVRRAFAERPDGMATIDFRIWGPWEAPKTDLGDRVLKDTAEGLLRRGLRQLFR